MISLSYLYETSVFRHEVAFHAACLAAWAYRPNEYAQQIRAGVGYASFAYYTPNEANAPAVLIAQDGRGAQIAIAGTTTTEQWLSYVTNGVATNVIALGGQTFGVFEPWSTSVQTEIVQRVSNTTPIFIAGHSLGGAMATLVGEKLKRLGYNVRAVYTFGCPRVADEVCLTGWRTPTHNVVVTEDPIPWLPPAILCADCPISVSQPRILHCFRAGTDFQFTGGYRGIFNVSNLVPTNSTREWAGRLPGWFRANHQIDNYLRHLYRDLRPHERQQNAGWLPVVANLWSYTL